jgi:hypothetical protein
VYMQLMYDVQYGARWQFLASLENSGGSCPWTTGSSSLQENYSLR